MSVVRKHHNKNYTVMSNYHFMDKTLSLKAKGLLSLMLSLPEDWDYSTKGLETLSQDGNTSVRSALNELEEHEYLIRERVFDGGKIVDWEYHIFESREDCQQFKEQRVENTHVETNNNKVRKQSITKEGSTKSNSKELLQNSNFSFGKQKPKKQNLFTKCVSLIDDKTNNKEVRSLLIDWLNMLLEKYKVRGKSLYVNVFKGKLNMLDKYDEKDWKEIIEYNLQRGYEGFYPIRDYTQSMSYDVRKGKPWEEGVRSTRYSKEELEELAELNRQREAQGLRTHF